MPDGKGFQAASNQASRPSALSLPDVDAYAESVAYTPSTVGSNVPEIQHQEPGDGDKVASYKIHIPNSSDMGTGTFTTIFTAKAFTSTAPVVSTMFLESLFQVSAALNQGRGILVSVGASKPAHHLSFYLPTNLVAHIAHTLVVEFERWKIVSAAIDGMLLGIIGSDTH